MLKFAIGDIHGCYDLLTVLVERCRAYALARNQPTHFIFLGDYVDRGPDSAKVVAFLRELQAAEPNTICLQGNHDLWMVKQLLRDPKWRGWTDWGGLQTLASYGAPDIESVPADDIDWLESLPVTYEDDLRFYVHAGVDPKLPLAQQNNPDVLLWIRDEFLLHSGDFGKLVVHGHTPLDRHIPDLRRNRLNLDTAAVFGGALTAAVFNDAQREPLDYLRTSSGVNWWRKR